MLEEINTQTISLTPAASKAVSDIIAERKLEGFALRVFLAGNSCCSGVSFGMALDNNIRADDKVFDTDNVKLVVDEVSLDYLQGASIDFVNDPERGAGFLVDSPVAREMQHEHDEGESCGCGGSCSCGN